MPFCPTVCEFITENRKVNLKNQIIRKGHKYGEQLEYQFLIQISR